MALEAATNNYSSAGAPTNNSTKIIVVDTPEGDGTPSIGNNASDYAAEAKRTSSKRGPGTAGLGDNPRGRFVSMSPQPPTEAAPAAAALPPPPTLPPPPATVASIHQVRVDDAPLLSHHCIVLINLLLL